MSYYTDNFEERIKITPNNIITYDYYIGTRSSRGREVSNRNLALSKTKEEISKKAQRRLLAAMDWLLLFSREKFAMNLKKGILFKYQLALLTLTLPASQMHDDNYIKKFLLNEFLTRLRKEYKVVSYLWKAEKQMNGNIHFHIVLDKYIYFKDANSIWNKILDHHGYIDKYRKNQQAQHANGFTPRKDMFKYWSYAHQLKAYKKGVETNWTQPSATSDIHSLRKIRNAKAYLAKYLTKNPDSNKFFSRSCEAYKKIHNVDRVPEDYKEELKLIIATKLQVHGNLWYISRNLSKVKGCVTDLTQALKNDLDTLIKAHPDKHENLDRCRLFKFNIHQVIEAGCMAIARTFARYIADFRAMFLPREDLEQYRQSIPLNIFEEI